MKITLELTEDEVRALETELGTSIRRAIGKRAQAVKFEQKFSEVYWRNCESAGRKLKAVLEQELKEIP